MSKEWHRLRNLYNLAVREEKKLTQQGIYYRMNFDRKWFEFHTKEAVYVVHPKWVMVKYLIGDQREDLIFKRRVIGGQIKGLIDAFTRYKYLGKRKDWYERVGDLVVHGFDLRNIY